MQIFSQQVAVATGRTLVPPGPRVPATDAIIEAEGLRAAAHAAAPHVASLSKLPAVAHWETAAIGQDVDILVVDRPGWITANAASLQVMLEPAFDRLAELQASLVKNIASDVTARFSGAQVGAVLAFLSTKVLGQFEPYAARAGGPQANPRLMLVAPNVMSLRQELKLDPADFHLWVSLHELTHAAQFAQAPWLQDYILDTATEFLVSNLVQDDELSAAAQAARTKALESKIVGVMSLLEGHANVIMDSVNRRLVPSVRKIRRRFDERSENHSWLSQLLRKLIGLDAKAKQYKQGQAFVSAVIAQIGIDQFNTVWQDPDHLPTADELDNADAWITRVLN